jgi:hypothetical protein
MKLIENKKGIYEYVLTKSVMLIFILGLVGIFYTLYNNLNVKSAADIADAEAIRISKEIDDAINFQGVSNTITVNLKRDLKVGREVVPYELDITEDGIVVIRFINYPYQDIRGVAKFGINLKRQEGILGGAEAINCSWSDIIGGGYMIVTKKSDYEYNPVEGLNYHVITVTIDASASCMAQMKFKSEYPVT